MPLLALPREIILEILDYLGEDPHADYGCDPIVGGYNMICVGATCRSLRIAALPYIYSYVSLSSNREAPICKFLNDYKDLIAYIRKLTCHYRGASDSSDANTSLCFFRDVIRHCTGLQHLKVICRHYEAKAFDFPAHMILEWIPSESRQSLQYLDIKASLKDILRCSQTVAKWSVNGEFCKLQGLRLESGDSESGRFFTRENNCDLVEIPEVTSEVLPQVRKLWLEIRTRDPERLGVFFAKMVPNVESLRLNVTRKVTFTILNTYVELGTKITELHIKESGINVSAILAPPVTNPDHLCELIPKLSGKLTKLTILSDVMFAGHPTFCHSLLSNVASWPLLTELTLEAARGCADLKPDVMHLAMTELTRTHPKVKILLKQSSTTIVSFNKGELKYIAPVEAFERFCFVGGSNGLFGADEFEFDDYDFEHDIEDSMEFYFENEDFEDEYDDDRDDYAGE